MSPEEYAKRHQKAFRAAFDFLNAHFPPGDNLGWWDQVAKDCADVCDSMPGNTLIIGLLTGIMHYLEDEYKLRRKDDEEP